MSQQALFEAPSPVSPLPSRTEPWFQQGDVTLFHGDCIEVMARMPANSVDAVVTDPPYGLGFMGQAWDTFKPELAETNARKAFQVGAGRMRNHENPNLRGRAQSPAMSPSQIEYDRTVEGQRSFQRWTEEWAREAYRVLKPGGHIIVCGAPRSAHRMVCGLEDAGFEIRDSIAWLFGSGFPKSFNLGCRCVGRRSVLGVSEEVQHSGVLDQKGEGADVLSDLQRQEAVDEDASTRGVQESQGDTAASSRTRGVGELRLEGRGDVQAQQGELHRPEVRSMPSGVSGDGSDGRLRDGAPSGDGGATGAVSPARRSGASHRSQHAEQRAGQSGVVSEQRSAQTSRGAEEETCPKCGGARAWDGWGTALKPGHEPIAVARKPMAGTVEENMAIWGIGALNIDRCRIETAGDGDRDPRDGHGDDIGRWPVNVALDAQAASRLDAQAGERKSGANPTRRGSDKFRKLFGAFKGAEECTPARGADTGGASRFFFVAKPSRTERDFGCDDLPHQTPGECTERKEGSAGITPYAGAGRSGGGRNPHPTVKPVALMRWLIWLVTPPGGIVLEPFLGSGTTGMAAAVDGYQFIGIEREEKYLHVGKARVLATLAEVSA